MRSVTLVVLLTLGPVLWPALPSTEDRVPEVVDHSRTLGRTLGHTLGTHGAPSAEPGSTGSGLGGSRPDHSGAGTRAVALGEPDEFGARDDRWVWPLVPRPAVVRGFERPRTDWAPGHRGIDLAGARGQRVLAASAGRVSFAGQVAGRGVLAVVHGGGLRTTYEPVRALVGVGQTVRAGEPIGLLNPGGHCAPAVCLHWGLIRGSFYLDPLAVFERRPPRLLPILSG